MPIHEFQCKKCGNIFEYLCFRRDDRDHARCPSCDHEEVEMLLSTFSSKGSAPKSSPAGLSSASSCSSSGGFS
jgi:putative FmdB family regulatory protein